MQSYDDEAIVLRKSISREDVRVVLFTKERGKLSAVAKGVRTLLSRRSPHIQTANYLHVFLHSRHDMWYLEKTELKSGFGGIKDDREKLRILYAFLFVLDRILPVEQKEADIFSAALIFMRQLHMIETNQAMDLFIQTIQLFSRRLGFFVSPESAKEDIILKVEEIIGEKIPFNTV